MDKKSQKIKELSEDLERRLSFCKFSAKHAELAALVKKGMDDGRQIEPYHYFGTRLCAYLFLLKEKSVNYLQILKYERDFCDDGGKVLHRYAQDYGVYMHSDIVVAFRPQNECFHYDDKHDRHEKSALIYLLRNLNHKITG